MKEIVVVGAGGIGGTFAALLAATGSCRVTLIGRPGPHLEAIERNGLRLEGLRELTADVAVADDASSLSSCDVLLVAVKAQDTDAALVSCRHIEVLEVALSVQNGVVKDERLGEAFGRERVVGALAIVAGERPAPGVARLTYDGGTRIGELDGAASGRVEGLVALLGSAGLACEGSSEIVSATWTKLVGWAPIGLLATLSGQSNAGVLSDAAMAREYVGMVRELASLAAAQGVPMLDLGPFQVRSWLERSEDAAVEAVMATPLASSSSTHSALQDVRRGVRTELGALLAPLLEDALSHDVSLTRVRALYAALTGLERELA